MDNNDLDFLKQKKENFINILKINVCNITELKDFFESNENYGINENNNSENLFNGIVLLRKELLTKGSGAYYEIYFCELVYVYLKIIERISFFSKMFEQTNSDYLKNKIEIYKNKFNLIEENMVKKLWLPEDVLFVDVIMTPVSICKKYGICLCSKGPPYYEKCLLA